MIARFAFTLVCGCLLFACKPTGPSEKNAEIARRVFEHFNRHDWKAMTELYSEQALFLDPSYGAEYVKKSREETIAKYRDMENMFPDIHDEVVGVYPSGDKVTVEFVSTGRNDSISFSLPIISVLTIKNGLIVKDATYYDL